MEVEQTLSDIYQRARAQHLKWLELSHPTEPDNTMTTGSDCMERELKNDSQTVESKDSENVIEHAGSGTEISLDPELQKLRVMSEHEALEPFRREVMELVNNGAYVTEDQITGYEMSYFELNCSSVGYTTLNSVHKLPEWRYPTVGMRYGPNGEYVVMSTGLFMFGLGCYREEESDGYNTDDEAYWDYHEGYDSCG